MSSAHLTRTTEQPRILRIHHLKLAVSRLDISLVWYEKVLGARHLPELDHFREDGGRFAVVCEMPQWSGMYIELRENRSQAIKDRGWDPITLLVQSVEDLEAWRTWLDGWSTLHSPVLTGARGWLLIYEDPDGRRFQIFTADRHDGSLDISADEYWLPVL